MERPVKVADEVWIATALLHREHPERDDFTISEIVERAEREKLTARLRPGVRVHATAHCVADLRPNPGRYRMLRSTPGGRRRLFRPGDPFHPDREGAKTTPSPDEIPQAYQDLLSWYETEYRGRGSSGGGESRPLARGVPDPLLDLRGSGAELWRDETPDQYVERLRSDW
jgi:hypothetical protein